METPVPIPNTVVKTFTPMVLATTERVGSARLYIRGRLRRVRGRPFFLGQPLGLTYGENRAPVREGVDLGEGEIKIRLRAQVAGGRRRDQEESLVGWSCGARRREEDCMRNWKRELMGVVAVLSGAAWVGAALPVKVQVSLLGFSRPGEGVARNLLAADSVSVNCFLEGRTAWSLDVFTVARGFSSTLDLFSATWKPSAVEDAGDFRCPEVEDWRSGDPRDERVGGHSLGVPAGASIPGSPPSSASAQPSALLL